MLYYYLKHFLTVFTYFCSFIRLFSRFHANYSNRRKILFFVGILCRCHSGMYQLSHERFNDFSCLLVQDNQRTGSTPPDDLQTIRRSACCPLCGVFAVLSECLLSLWRLLAPRCFQGLGVGLILFHWPIFLTSAGSGAPGFTVWPITSVFSTSCSWPTVRFSFGS